MFGVMYILCLLLALMNVIGVFLIVLPVDQLLTMLMPLILFGVTALVTYIKSDFPGWVVLLLVSALGAIAAWITTLIVPDLSWLQTFAYNLLAVFVNEVLKQLKQGNTKPV
jgi:hypothetical protein